MVARHFVWVVRVLERVVCGVGVSWMEEEEEGIDVRVFVEDSAA